MALESWTIHDISSWENQLQEAATELRKIRMGMQEEKMETVELESAEAIKRITKIHSWAIDCEGRFRKQKGQNAAKKTRESYQREKNIKPHKS